MPVANGKQIDWFTGWDGVKRLASIWQVHRVMLKHW